MKKTGNELNIRKVELADDGLYECRVYLINGPSKAINIYLKVNGIIFCCHISIYVFNYFRISNTNQLLNDKKTTN